MPVGTFSDSLDCPICLCLYSDPRVVPCGHTFCALCIAAHTRRQGTCCPVCQAPLQGITTYPNEALKALVDVQTQKDDDVVDIEALDEQQVEELLQRLLKRKLGEDRTREILGCTLMVAFLERCLREKKADLKRVDEELKFVEEDLRALKGRLGEQDEGNGMQLKGRGNLVERFSDNVEKEYFERRRVKGEEGVREVVNMLVDATAFSAIRRRGGVQHVDILRTNNSLISSIEFNAPANLFATAGVTKRIKVFEFEGMLQTWNKDAGRIEQHHYPILEIPTVSKLSCLSWSHQRHSVLAASTYKGDILIHDTETNTLLDTLREHSRRIWYVDFSAVKPNLLLSGSDDHTVKLWDADRHQSCSVMTLKTSANVCCVKFNPLDAHQLAFGSADHNVYSYDLRQPSHPLCVFEGHWRAVSHVLFLNRSELISASTDSSCKLWNVQKQQPGLSYAGHTNDKNFVGLTGCKDFFACGSEDNAVYIYHKGFAGPIVRYEVGSSAAFVSTVAWKPKSNLLVAANNAGEVEILELY